jgi:DNA-directed RNA polymerase specialized sigma24 family protein
MSSTLAQHTPHRRPAAARPGAAVPADLADRLRRMASPRDQLIAIAEHERRRLERSVAGMVGATNAEDVVSEVIVRQLERHATDPTTSYASVEGYHRLRASLIRSTRNAAIDMTRRRAWAEVLAGGPGDPHLRGALLGCGGDPDGDSAAGSLAAALDGAALYDALRRIDPADADVLRVKLMEGATFAGLAEHLGVRSTNAAYKRYLRAIRAAQSALARYGAGGYCADSAPYLALLAQEVAGDLDHRPLSEILGEARAEAIRLHVWGASDTPGDDGCHGCQIATRREGRALAMFLPPALLAMPVPRPAGLVAAVAGVRDAVTTWLEGVLTGLGPAAPGGAGLLGRGAALTAAATLTLGGAATIRTLTPGGTPPAPAPAVARVRVALVAVPPGVRTRNRAAPPARTARSPDALCRSCAPAPHAASTTGSAAREFTPGP